MSVEVLALLDEMNQSNRIAYDDYSALHDAVSALIPEPPTDDNERDTIAATVFAELRECDLSLNAVFLGMVSNSIASAIIASPVWRNRGRGPITEAVEVAKWAIARERFERVGLDPEKVKQRDADRCEADARGAIEALEAALDMDHK